MHWQIHSWWIIFSFCFLQSLPKAEGGRSYHSFYYDVRWTFIQIQTFKAKAAKPFSDENRPVGKRSGREVSTNNNNNHANQSEAISRRIRRQDFQQIRGRLGTNFPSHFVFLVTRGSFPFLSQARSRAKLVSYIFYFSAQQECFCNKICYMK